PESNSDNISGHCNRVIARRRVSQNPRAKRLVGTSKYVEGFHFHRLPLTMKRASDHAGLRVGDDLRHSPRARSHPKLRSREVNSGRASWLFSIQLGQFASQSRVDPPQLDTDGRPRSHWESDKEATWLLGSKKLRTE